MENNSVVTAAGSAPAWARAAPMAWANASAARSAPAETGLPEPVRA